ncbi:MAG TPA: cupin domain-containing protein [Gemmatimonadaceae bacterium]|jgi:predicted cupin superfamily sugar epimerase|nr:cupin domain-containing protein [Gemmatimonadaceae bacterium]
MANDARVAELVRRLDLTPHPEGGHYRETFRSAAMTTIAFLLVGGGASRWHRVVGSDEVWHYYEGAPLALWTLEPLVRTVIDADHRTHVVPAGHWQAARTLGDYTLVGCDVAPAFEFANFSLLDAHPAEAARLVARHPDIADLL